MRRTWWGVATAVVAACGGGDGSPSPAYTLERVAGDSQQVEVTTASAPLVVRVVDQDSLPVAGITVNFAVTQGSGTVTASDVTDGDGLASGVYTAASDAGARKVRAQIPGVTQTIFDLRATAGGVAGLQATQGQDTPNNAGSPVTLAAKVVDGFGNAVAGAKVAWGVVSGGGAVSADTVLSDVNGIVSITRTLGSGAGGQFTRAVAVAANDTLVFHNTARKAITVLAGGNNVPDQCTSDLWIQGNYGYTGTWGSCEGQGAHLLHVWNVTAGVTHDTAITVGTGTVSDNEVSDDGALMLATSEAGSAAANGLYLYSLSDPAHPALLEFEVAARGLHTGTFAVIGGQRYVFAARNPHSTTVAAQAALMVYRIQPDSADKIVQVAALTQPENYGIHDTFVRDGLAFVSDWNTGMRIYDVGDGRLAGSPASPQLVGSIVTGAAGLNCNCVHNSWWYHDAQGGKRYLFIGQEGPSDFTTASGDIHVVDLSNMAAPEEVAFFHIPNAGVHNFWMDEARGILYAAYYNAGVVALDVTGTLSGDLASREIARIQPGGAGNTFTWGVMLANGSLWASDMFSGFWKLSVP
ncbi:MAG TPA: hypothetical protein VG712_07860 [Gemmatimonadales bacterium]|nr:hypothetical protein [Gemmatimonadales bacterium]